MSEGNFELADERKSIADDAYSSLSEELTATKSGPNVRLTILGEKLNIAETKCDTLKSRLDYMKILFHGVPTEATESNEQPLPTTDKPEEDAASAAPASGSAIQKSNPNDDLSDNMKYHMFRKEIQKIQRFNQEEDVRISDSREDNAKSKFVNQPSDAERQSIIRDIAKTIYDHPNTDRPPLSPPSRLPECITVPPLRKVKKKQEMIVNLSENAENTYTITRKNLSKEGRKYRPDLVEATRKKPSVSTVGESVKSKAKRKRGRLQGVLSKNTVTLKDTNFIGRKELKRRRYKGCISSLSQDQVSLASPRRNRSEVVEIYHNVAVKSDSISAVSSKHSKYDPQKISERRLTPFGNNKNGRVGPLQNLTEDPKDEQASVKESFVNEQHSNRTISASTRKPEFGACNQVGNPDETSDKLKTHEEHHVMFHENYYDPLATRNYETPTLASRLKRSNRSYFSRFNFKNIPFVVGTSVTPSYNLGLNIQQVLSIMKMRQPTLNSVAPLLIRKVSRGMQPVSILMEHMSHQCEETCDKSARMARNVEEASDFQRLKVASTSQIRYGQREDADKDWTGKERPGADHGKANLSRNANGPKGIRDVLVNLHDQFEQMNAKYEKLQAETEKTDDANLQTEMVSLEKDLNAKEKEINAVIGLYKEVMTLKRQLKRMQDKNSLVCIATESPAMQSNSDLPMSPVPVHNRTTKSLQTFATRRGHLGTAMREPSTSIRLASLLRQIQLYQRQLQLAT